ncbi:hypothetical protein [Nostoc sp.]|uniref:hypothetical protein n=1 Tax=Nostoc sp. TaxID=1180 RepID=UPI002FFA20F7
MNSRTPKKTEWFLSPFPQVRLRWRLTLNLVLLADSYGLARAEWGVKKLLTPN